MKLDANAVKVMADAGVNISKHHPKHIRELRKTTFGYVVTVCDNARESCPIFLGHVDVIHRPFDDPPHLAKLAASEEDRLAAYRRVRDAIRTMVEGLPCVFSSQRRQSPPIVDMEVSR